MASCRFFAISAAFMIASVTGRPPNRARVPSLRSAPTRSGFTLVEYWWSLPSLVCWSDFCCRPFKLPEALRDA